MTRTAEPSPTVVGLARRLLDRDPGDPLADELVGWLSGSARFRAFAEANRDKIRKKLRGAADDEAARDVRAELQAARLLLADRRVELAFEAYGSGRGGPDFTVTYRVTRTFNVEVTRLRRVPTADGFATTLAAKLRQLPPSTANALLVALPGAAARALDVEAAARGLRSRADAGDEPFFARHGFDGSRGFYDRYLRLGGVVAWCEEATGDGRAAPWVNRSARIRLPDQAVRAWVACLRTDERE